MTLSVQRRDRLTAVVGVCMLAWCLGARCAQHALVAGVWDYEAPALALQAPWATCWLPSPTRPVL